MTLAALGGCWSDKAIDVTLDVPSAQVSALYDTSCVTAVEIYVDGGNYPTDRNDFLRDCIDLTRGGATFADIKAQIHGKFDLKLPASGISGMEIYGFDGTCNAASTRDYDLLFYGSAPYIGGDTLDLPITPNVSCTKTNIVLRPVDILKYVKTSTCAMSTWTTGKLALSTLSPLPFTNGETYWWGGQAAGLATSGSVAVQGIAQNVGAKSCLAVGLYLDDWYEVTCTPPPDQRLCATGADIEAPMINTDVAFGSTDSTKINKFGAMIVGAVVGPGPIANATVAIDPEDADKGEVVYFDLPPGVENGTGTLTPHAGSSTGTSGLFGIYSEALIHITVTSGGKVVKRTIAGNQDDATAVLVKMN